MYSVKVQTQDGQEKHFIASYPYVLDEEQKKLLWTVQKSEEHPEGQEKITVARIKVVIEKRTEDGSQQKIS